MQLGSDEKVVFHEQYASCPDLDGFFDSHASYWLRVTSVASIAYPPVTATSFATTAVVGLFVGWWLLPEIVWSMFASAVRTRCWMIR
jgi:hypothetical protein